MWKKKKVWLQFEQNIMATDPQSAIFLISFNKYSALNKTYLSALEVVDIQKYTVINNPVKVKIALKENIRLPFVFVIGKN